MDRDPLESGAIAPEESPSRPDAVRPSGVWDTLGQLWQQYPLLFWSAIWTSMLVMAAIAMSGLMNPELSQPVHLKVSDHPIANDDPEAPMAPLVTSSQAGAAMDAVPTEQDSPLWLFLLLTASCGMGCVALSARLQESRTTPRQRLQRLEALAQSLPTEQEAIPLTPHQTAGLERFILPVPPTPNPLPPLESLAETSSHNLPETYRAASERPQSHLTELNHMAPGLAELLDIQRRREGKREG